MASYGNNGQYLDYVEELIPSCKAYNNRMLFFLVLRVLAIGGGRHAGFLILAGYATLRKSSHVTKSQEMRKRISVDNSLSRPDKQPKNCVTIQLRKWILRPLHPLPEK